MFRRFASSIKSFFLSIFGSREAVARLAVQYATYKVLEETQVSPKDLIAAIDALSYADATFNELRDRLVYSASFESLDPSERLLIQSFAKKAFDASSKLEGVVQPSERVKIVLGWVREAAASAS